LPPLFSFCYFLKNIYRKSANLTLTRAGHLKILFRAGNQMLFSQKRIIIIANAPDFVRETPIMKRCPQCSTVFENENAYCLNDGTPLIDENFSLPSSGNDFEDETVIRREPIVVDLAEQNHAPRENLNRQIQPPPIENVVVRVPAKSNSKNAAVYLALGLLLGGVLVLGTLILARSFYSGGNAAANANSKQISVNVSEPNLKAKSSNSTLENRAENKNVSVTPTMTIGIHDQRTDADDEEFNGRVIAQNAYVRASPSKSATQIDVLPLDDRINIDRRENESSPWFYVTCEHGASGWMHGDTIEYTKQ